MAREEINPEERESGEDAAEMRVYELGFHLDPELPQEEAKATYKSIKDLISANGTVVTEGEPEKIQLAYTISRMETTGRHDFNASYFAWIAYEAAGAGHAAVLEAVRENTSIVRFLDLRTSKEAALHAAEMQEFYRMAPERDAAMEELADADEVAPVSRLPLKLT